MKADRKADSRGESGGSVVWPVLGVLVRIGVGSVVEVVAVGVVCAARLMRRDVADAAVSRPRALRARE